MADVIITPASGIVEFIPSSTTINKIEASGNTFNLINTANASGTVFNIEASNGSLFSVVDSLNGSLMSVNNNAGLPVLEVFSDDSIVGGRFGQNDFVVSSGGDVGIGTSSPSTKLHVVGDISVQGDGGTGSIGVDSVDPMLILTPPSNDTMRLTGDNIQLGTDYQLDITTSTATFGNVAVGIDVDVANGQLKLSRANSTTTGGGQIYLNGATGNRIDFNTNGIAPPSFTTRSAGTKIVLYPQVDASNVDFAIGIESSTLWQSVGSTARQFKWYAGTTNIATLTGAGVLTVAGSTSQINVDNLRLDGNTLSSTDTNGNIILTPNGTGGIAGGASATVTGSYAVVGGGYGNTASNSYATVGGGGGSLPGGNTASGYVSTVAGGADNTSSGTYSFVGGGKSNCATAEYSNVSGGRSNCACGINSTVNGGYSNKTLGRHSTISGGNYNYGLGGANECCSRGATISGGVGNNTRGGTVNATTGDFSVVPTTCYTAGAFSTIGGGLQNISTSTYSTVGGGNINGATALGSVVSGGKNNTASGGYSVIGGGINQGNAGGYGTIAGGLQNGLTGNSAAIGGGRYNIAYANWSTVAGGNTNKICASATGSFIGGGSNNTANTSTCNSSIVGGAYNSMTSSSCYNATIGGYGNTNSGWYNFIGVGTSNYITSSAGTCWSTIVGGQGNEVCDGILYGAILNGAYNCTASGYYSTIINGSSNSVSAAYGTIINGYLNCVQHSYSTIAGCAITTDRSHTLFVNNLSIKSIPTSSAGLPAGSVYSDSCTLKIV